jgi:CRISPR system Cascade subunit CasD
MPTGKQNTFATHSLPELVMVNVRDTQAVNLVGAFERPVERDYVQDAVFLVGLESSDRGLLEQFQRALAKPFYQLFLGRRSCPPDGPIQTNIVDMSLEDALDEAPWAATTRYRNWSLKTSDRFPQRLQAQIIVEPLPSENTEDFSDGLSDEPVSFDIRHRRYKSRRLKRLHNPKVFESENDPSGEQPNDSPQNGVMFEGDAIFDTVATISRSDSGQTIMSGGDDD